MEYMRYHKQPAPAGEGKESMEKRYCAYCGAPLEDGCECEREAARAREDFIDEYESRPDVNYGWAQQDLIDMYRFER